MTVLWLDGALVPAADARIDPADRGLLLGDGLFETMRVEAGAPLRLEAHLRRLREGARLLGLPVPRTDEALADAVAAVVRANGLADAAVRLTLTAGAGPRGLLRPDPCRPTLMLAAAPLPPPPGPARLVIAAVTRRNEHSPLSRVKSLNYLDGVLAREEAKARGADDAVLLNTAGRVAEATAANLFAVVDGTLVTPPLSDGVLPGTMRAEIIRTRGAVERSLDVADLRRATEVFLTSALSIRQVLDVAAADAKG
ncbi:MAG TPA: aminotransferase class IV [Azospirillaceae bacterium]|nr:aminotransferase class IV [Azospirillaceae bacterium]